MQLQTLEHDFGPSPIAIVGLACRFPGASDVQEYWRNLRDGVESITIFTDEELAAAGIDNRERQRANYVPAKGYVQNATLFDAEFFGMTPREAEITDPQQRLMLECAWEALEEAGYGDKKPGPTAVVVSGSTNAYLRRLLANQELLDSIGLLRILLGNDKDHLATWISYKLDLSGPSVTVQTACSSSLVAVHTACQFLLTYQCDVAVAGGVTLGVPAKSGYLYEPGGILSPDGHSRSFDARAQGSVPGEGAGIVVLRRLADAIAAKDNIRAVIRGSAINNDGAAKVGFTAPSISGQLEVIRLAHANAEIDSRLISYVEAHGSATRLGDPVEFAALAKAFAKTHGTRIALGSVKSNIGHAGAAAGIAGLIKTALALEHKQIPPSLHFETPNPEIEFSETPFHIVRSLQSWDTPGPRMAGVSSFGLGGTNAHVVLQDAPAVEVRKGAATETWRILPVSARTAGTLQQYKNRLHAALADEDIDFGNTTFTLQTGRKRFDHRFAVVCRTREGAREAIGTGNEHCFEARNSSRQRPVVYLFPGVGDQYPGMAGGLYRTEPAFRRAFDQCATALKADSGIDLSNIVCTNTDSQKSRGGLDFRAMVGRSELGAPSQALDQTVLAHCAVFAIEYALAQLWLSYEVRPVGMLGYSLGEYVCAAVSGVLPVEVMIKIVAKRGEFARMYAPGGAMLAVPLPADTISSMIGPDVHISGIAGPDLTLLAGSAVAIDHLQERFSNRAIATRKLPSAHAFHSRDMRAAADALKSFLHGFEFQPASIPYVSNLTGQWITSQESISPEYWRRHLCEPVRLSDGLMWLIAEMNPVFLELGPGQMLTSLVERLNPDGAAAAVPTLPAIYDHRSDSQAMTEAIARLWLAGADIQWDRLPINAHAARISLPSYPFERQHYEIPEILADAKSRQVPESNAELQAIRWRQAGIRQSSSEPVTWIVIGCDNNIGELLSENKTLVNRVVTAHAASNYLWIGHDDVQLDLHSANELHRLINEVSASAGQIQILVDTDMERWSSLLDALVAALRRHVEKERVAVTPLTRDMLDVPSTEHESFSDTALLRTYASVMTNAHGVVIRPVDIGRQSVGTTTIVRALLHAQGDAAVLAVAVRRRTIWALESVKAQPWPALPTKGAWAIVGNPFFGGSSIVEPLSRNVIPQITLIDSSQYLPAPGNTTSSVTKLESLLSTYDVLIVCILRAQFVSIIQSLNRRRPDQRLIVVLYDTYCEALQPVLHQELASGPDAACLECSFLIVDPSLSPDKVAQMLTGMCAHDDGAVYIAKGSSFEHSVPAAASLKKSDSGPAIEPDPSDDNMSETERIVSDVWRRVLGTAVIRPADNFFRIGGNSLLGLQVTSELRRLFEIDLSPHSLFASPTLSNLAETIEDLLLQEISEVKSR